MAYCAVSDVESYYLNYKADAVDGYVTSAEIQAYIDQMAAFIDLKLGALYQMPITDAIDLLVLKSINSMYVVGIVDDIFRHNDAHSKLDRKRESKTEADEMLRRITDPTYEKYSSLNSDKVALGITFNNDDFRTGVPVRSFNEIPIEPARPCYDSGYGYRNGVCYL